MTDDCPVCGSTLITGMTGPGTVWCDDCEMEYWREGNGWWRCDESGEPENVKEVAAQ